MHTLIDISNWLLLTILYILGSPEKVPLLEQTTMSPGKSSSLSYSEAEITGQIHSSLIMVVVVVVVVYIDWMRTGRGGGNFPKMSCVFHYIHIFAMPASHTKILKKAKIRREQQCQ